MEMMSCTLDMVIGRNIYTSKSTSDKINIMTKKKKEMQFKVIIEQDEDGMYVASVPELPGCYTQGKTLEQVRERIKEVIVLVLEEEKEIAREKARNPKSSFSFFGIEDVTINYA